MGTTGRSEQGSVLIIAMIAMLTLGIVSVSLALLARVEVSMGMSLKQLLTADALAEGALDHALETVRPGALGSGRFTDWIATVVADGVEVGGGRYWARVDNDCPPAVPETVQQDACPTATDTNGTAVVTGWAQAGAGRSRARAIVKIDRPWAHVCSSARLDEGGLCGDPRNGSLAVIPADSNDPNGPAAYDALPVPILGCSRIDPGLHAAASGCPPGSRLVLTGADPLAAPGAAACHDDVGGAGRYFGYFDCALQTPCQPAAACPGGATRGCVRPADSRLLAQPTLYREPGPSGCAGLHPDSVTGDGSPATGLVFNYGGAPAARRNPSFANIGSPGGGVVIYVLRSGNDGQVAVGNGTVHGTLVVEGNGTPSGGDECSPSNADVVLGDAAVLRTDVAAYGYPIAVLAYDPSQAVPNGTPYAPQSICASVGTTNTAVHGIVYSGGHVRFKSVGMAGSVVAFEIQTESSADARLAYDAGYGSAAPPPGFGDSGNRVVLIRKSFVLCSSFSDERGGPSPCP